MAEDLFKAKGIDYFDKAELLNLPLLPCPLAAGPTTRVLGSTATR
jgi:hypothetical protein